MNPFIFPAMSLYEGGFGINWSTKVDMPLNKGTKPNQIYTDWWKLFRFAKTKMTICPLNFIEIFRNV